MNESLISAPWLLDPARPPVAEGALLLDAQGTVLAAGPRADVRRASPSTPERRARGALMPALVNAHVHLELGALRGQVAGGGGMVAWVGRLQQARAATDPGRLGQGAMEAAAEQIRFGVGAVGDVGNELQGALAAGAAGLHGVFFHELLGSSERGGGDAVAAARASFAAVDWPAGLGYVPAPHAPYSVPPALFRRILDAAARIGLPTSIHAAEDEDEVHLLRDGTGRWAAVLQALGAPLPPAGHTPVEYLASLGAFDGPAPPLLVHMVHLTDDDRRRVAAAGATIVLCPRSNLHIGGRLADVPALLAEGIGFAVGTDSLASCPDGSLWAELVTLREQFPRLPEALWLQAAVHGADEALRVQHETSLEPGARPRLIDVALDDPAHPVASLVRNPRPEVTWP